MKLGETGREPMKPALRDHLILAAIFLIFLAPFIDKAVHIDDPLFIWPSLWLREHPGHAYSFALNWFGVTKPMPVTNFNPPLTSYWIALISSTFGFSEPVLHAGFFLAAFVSLSGIYFLAKEWSGRPFLSAIIALVTPVFFISTTTLMCDMLMFAFSIWSVVLWQTGLRSGKVGLLLLAGVLLGAAILTKYTAVSLVGLLVVLGALHERRAGWWLAALAVPLLMLAAFEVSTAQTYGKGLFSLANQYASANRSVFGGGWAAKLMSGLAFAGGSSLPILLFAPLLWTRRVLLAGGLGIFALCLGILLWLKKIGPMELAGRKEGYWLFVVQMALMAGAGLHLLLLSVMEWRQRRDDISAVIGLWIIGTFVLGAVLNWTVSARTFLPMIAPAAILIARRVQWPESGPPKWTDIRSYWPLIASAAVTLLVARGDLRLANSARDAALQTAIKYRPSGARIWFEGHWGLQYYLQNVNAQPVDYRRTTLSPGDLLILPSNNTNIDPPAGDSAVLLEVIEFQPCSWLTTMNTATGAGFYAADWGPIPFAFGRVPPERYTIVQMIKPVEFRASKAIQRQGGVSGKQ